MYTNTAKPGTGLQGGWFSNGGLNRVGGEWSIMWDWGGPGLVWCWGHFNFF